MFDWQSTKDAPIRDALEKQPPHVTAEFERRLAESILNLNEQVQQSLISAGSGVREPTGCIASLLEENKLWNKLCVK